MGPDVLKNLQAKQDGLEGQEAAENMGWPGELSDPSSPLGLGVTNGSNGEQNNMDIIATSQQKRGEHHLAEGKGDKGGTNTSSDNGGGRGEWNKTSQQKRDEHATPESGD